MDRILLTGATGFVGKQILKQLENKGHQSNYCSKAKLGK